MNFGDLARSGTAPNTKYKTPSLVSGSGAQVRPKTRSGGDIDLNDFNVDLRTNKITSQGNDMDNSDFRKVQIGDEYAKAMESFQAAVDNWSGKKDPTVSDINSRRPESRNRITKDPKKASVLAAYTQNVPSILLQPSKKVKSVSSSPRAGKTTANHFNELRAAYGADFAPPPSSAAVPSSSAAAAHAASEKVASPPTVKVPKGPKLVQIARYQEESMEAGAATLRSSSAKPSTHQHHYSERGGGSAAGERGGGRDREGGGAAGGEPVRPHTVKSAYLSGGPMEVIRPTKKAAPSMQSQARQPSKESSSSSSSAYQASAAAAASAYSNSYNNNNNSNKIPASYSYDLADFEDVEEDLIYSAVDSPHEMSSSSFALAVPRGGGGGGAARVDPHENSKMPSTGSVNNIRSAVRTNNSLYPDDMMGLSGSPSESYLSEKILSKQNNRSLLAPSGTNSNGGGATPTTSSNTPSKRKTSLDRPPAAAVTSDGLFSPTGESEDGSPRTKVTPAVEVVGLKTTADKGGEAGSSGAAGSAIERPQSRKLYLGNDKTNSSSTSGSGASKTTLKAPRSAGARYSNFSPTHHHSTGFEEGGPFSPEGGSSYMSHPVELRRMSSFSAVQVTKPWLEEDHLPVRRPPSRQSSAFPVHLAEPPQGGAAGSSATSGGGGGGGSAVGNSSTEKAGSTSANAGSASLSTPGKSSAAKQRRKEDLSGGLIKTGSTSPPSPEVFLDSASGDSGNNFNVLLSNRPPSRQKVAAQHLFEGLTSAAAGTSDAGINASAVTASKGQAKKKSSNHSDADEVESEEELKVNSSKKGGGGGAAGVGPAGGSSVFSVPNALSSGAGGVGIGGASGAAAAPPSTAPEMMSSDLDGPPSTAQPRSRTAVSRSNNKNRNGLYYNPRDDGFSELDTNGVGGHLAPFAITVNYGPSAARLMLRDDDSDYIVVEEYNHPTGNSSSSSNHNNNSSSSGNAGRGAGRITVGGKEGQQQQHRRMESSDSVEYINLNTAASELSLISNTPRDGGNNRGNRAAALSWEDHTPGPAGGGGGGMAGSSSHSHLLPTRPKSVAGPSSSSALKSPGNPRSSSFYQQAAASGHQRVKSAGETGSRAATAGAAVGGGSTMRPIDNGRLVKGGSSPKNMMSGGGWTNESGGMTAGGRGATGGATAGGLFVESVSQPALGIRHMQTESPANLSFETGNYIQQDDDNMTIMSEESCREGADSPLSVRSFTLESSLGEDFLNLFASRR